MRGPTGRPCTTPARGTRPAAPAGCIDGEPFTDAVYHTLGLFKQRYPDRNAPPVWYLDVARYLAPASVWLLALRALLGLFRAQVDAGRAARSRGHVVVCGLGRRGERLVRLLRAEGWTVVGVERDPAGAGVASCRQAGGIVVVGDATVPAVLAKAGTAAAARLVAVCTDDETNAEIASRTGDLGLRMGTGPTRIVHIDDDVVRTALNERAVAAASPGLPGIEFFSVPQRAAASILGRYEPVPAGAEGRGPVVVGLTSLGTALVLQLARRRAAGEAGGGPLRVVVVEEQAGARVDQLARLHPGLARRCQLVPVDLDGTVDLHRTVPSATGAAVGDPDGRPSAVYVCVEPDLAALGLGLAFRRWLGPEGPAVVVAVRSAEESVARFLHDRDDDGVGGLSVVGLIEQTCVPPLLFDTVGETVARALHDAYLRQVHSTDGFDPAKSTNARPWDELSERIKEDNRAQARHLASKMASLGADIRLSQRWDDPLFDLDEQEVEALARMEHERWVEARLAEGPRRSTAAALAEDPDLAPWDQLPEDRRDIDRAFVRALPSILARAGLSVARDARGGTKE